MGKSRLRCSVICAFIVLSVLWKPAHSEDKCNVGCRGSPSGPAFLNGHKYNYGVEGTVTIYLTGADKQETSVQLLGQVSVSSLGNCAHVLKVQNLVISGPDGKKYNKPSGLEKPVRFTLQDGRIGPEICTEEGDTRRSLNIKRAIISLLQTEQKSSTQVDIFSTCPTDVSSSQEGGALLVHRSRDLSRCGHREQGTSDLITAVYNPTAEIKDSQILQSNLHIETKVNNGVPEKVAATEEYLYRPFSVGENGARAKVLTKLTLTGKTGGADNGNFNQVRTIIFESPHGVKSEHSTLQSALNIIKETAKTVAQEASSKSAGSFAQVVRILRTTSKDELIKIYNQVKSRNLEKRVFLDGLLRAGTGASIEASIQLLKNNDLSQLEQQVVFLSLGNAKHVNNEAIKAAAGLLDLPNLPKEIYLGVGALAGAYCREHECHTAKADGVVALSQKLAAKLQNCKPKNKVDEDTVVAILKGIRSIRHLEDNLVDKVARCAADNGAKNRVRAAALEAFGADPCAAKLKKTALDLLKNRQLDSEIRIKAYLAVIQCPCGKSANEIKNLLENEPVHQVGRFITTSLRFIRSSANPDKQLAKQHYGQIRTPNKFNVDDRKYSYYGEVSYNLDALGVGGSIEETVIYSQNSFLPRSAAINITTEVFGQNLNVLEVGGRQGNLDRVIEHFLGPKGYFNTHTPQEVYNDVADQIKTLEGKVKENYRGRRSVKAEIDNFDKIVKAESAPYNNELDLDVYVKLFGTDAVFLSLGDDKGINFDSIISQLFKIGDSGINKLKHFQQEYRAHLLFLDAELSYPTSTGFALKLDLVGAATARVDLSASIDIKQILRNPENAKLDVKVVPSTDVEVAGLFLVDADAVSTGLKVVTNLHSSTGAHVIAKVIENGHGIDLQLGLPVDKQEIVTASSDLVYVTIEKGEKEKETALKLNGQTQQNSQCFDQLASILGVVFCFELSLPFTISGPSAQKSISEFVARYPLTGPSKIKVVLEKDDLRGYHVKGVLHADSPGKRSFDLLFEAEGSKNRRTQLSGELLNLVEEKTIRLSLESPIKTVGGQISLYTKPNEYAALVKARLDDQEYYGRAGFSVQGNERRSVFRPVAEYQLPGEQGKNVLKIDGQLVREINGPSSKYTVEGIKIALPNSNEIIHVNGQYVQDPKDTEIEIKLKKGEHNVLLTGFVKGHDVKLEFQNTLNPYINFKVIGYFENGETIHNDIDLYYGGDLRNSQNRVKINQLYKYRKGPGAEDFNVITKNKLEIFALPFKVELDAELDPKKVDVELEGLYYDKKAKFELEGRTQIKKPGDYSVKVKAEVDKQGVEAFAKRDVISADKSNYENYIVIKNFAKYELSGVVIHKTKPNDYNVGAIGHLKISGGGKSEDVKFDIGAVETAKLYSSHAKISGSQGDYVDYLLKITRDASPSGQLKLILKDAIAANGQFKVTDNDGKGNGVLIIEFKKVQRKIKADVKFLVKEPVYNVDLDLYLNYEKDNNDKICLSTNTRATDKVFDSKNHLEINGGRTELNIYEEGEVAVAGKTHANIELVLPTQRCLTFKVDRELNINKDETANGHAKIVLSDASQRGGQASSITYKGKLTDSNIEKDIINYEGQVEVKLQDGKQLTNNFVFKSNVEGEKYKYDFKSDVNGNLIPAPASLVVSSTGTRPDSIDGTENYRVKGSYGNDYGFELVGNGEIKVLEKGTKKYLDDSTLTLRLPFEKAHDIKIVSNTLFLYTDNKDVIAEYTITESVQINADVYKVDTSGKIGVKHGFNKIKVAVPHVEPFSLDVNYKANLEAQRKTGNVELKALYGKGHSASVIVDVAGTAQEANVKIRANAPQAEKLKKLEINVHAKNPSTDTYSSTVTVQADGRVYRSDSLIVYSKAHPLIDLKYTNPNVGKPVRIYLKGESLSSTQGKLDVKIENLREINLDGSAEVSLQNDNIDIKLRANSKDLHLDNSKLDISTKDSGNGKRLEFNAVNANKNVLSGSTTFISKQDGWKTIIEGSGILKIQDQQKSANFKYIRTLLTEGNEQGVETFTNLSIDERSYVAETRITNVEYKASYVYCEEKKQCAHAELHSKINAQQTGLLQHQLNVGLDLRKLGITPEFGLQVSSEISEKRLPQYLLDLHINKEDKKYHLHVYSQPETGRFPSGITITLPQRVLSLESVVTYADGKSLPFPVQGEVVLHLDKNKPQQKTAVRFSSDVTGSANEHSGNVEIGFSHPKLGKEAVIKIRGKVAQPSENILKVETAASICHPSLGPDRESKVLLDVNPVHIKLLVDTPIVQIIDLEGSSTIKDNLQQADLKFSLLQGKPVQVRGVVKDFKYYEFTTGYSDDTERKLSIIGHVEPEKRIDISADIILPGGKKNIAHGALFLQDNEVKSEYGASKKNFNYFVNALKKDLDTLESRIKQLGEKASNDVKNTLQRVEPTFENLEKAYIDELRKILNEISNDKLLKEISEVLAEVINFVAKIITTINEPLEPIVNNITKTLTETLKQIEELYEKKLEPQLKQLYSNVAALAKEYLDGLIDIVAHVAAIVADYVEKNKPALQELTNVIAEIFRDITRLIVVQLKELRIKAAEVLSDFTEQIKELPIVGAIKEKFEELTVPDQVFGLLEELNNRLRPLLPTEETRKLASTVYSYLTKKLSRKSCDDAKEIKAIYEDLVAAVISLVQYARAQLNQLGVPALLDINSVPLISGPSQTSIPSLGGPPSVSIINQLIKGDLPDPLALIRAYRPRSLNPLEEIPAKLRAVVINGQHLFTFDGRHLTFPGNCRYVLAHDHVDRNFTLALQLQNGQPKSLILYDKSGATIEIKENGQVALNGAAHGYPVQQDDIFAFRQPSGRVGLYSRYGLLALCTKKLEVCYIEISGFYLGKLRGLLGDGNNEPFDDFRLPNGKICTSESEFGNAYKLSSSCPAVKTPDHSHHHGHHAPLPAACEQVFGGSSPLRPLALLLDVAPFRQACTHAVASDPSNALKEACDLGRGYAALAATGLLPAAVPPACVQCTDVSDGKPRAVGDTYELTLPAKQVDIVVTVETTQRNEELFKTVVVPLVGQVLESLKSKGVNDIKVYLVGITSKHPYPIIYDTDPKLTKPKVAFDDRSHSNFYDRAVHTNIKFLNHIFASINALYDVTASTLELNNVDAAYRAILDLPLRAGAVKHFIYTTKEKYSRTRDVFREFTRAAVFRGLYEQLPATATLVTSLLYVKVDGADTAPEGFVGFTKDAVLLYGQKKSEPYSKLEYDDDEFSYFVKSVGGIVLSASHCQKEISKSLPTATDAITHKILGTKYVQECTCTYVDPFRVRSVCVNKETKDTGRRRK